LRDERSEDSSGADLGAAGAMIAAILIGVCAGVVAGLLGVGGGVLFVPGLVIFLGLGQHQAEATSLLAIIPVAVVGTFKQDRYGNVRRHDALLMGLLSIAGAVAGVALANALSGTVLRVGFAALMVLVAIQLVRKALSEPENDGSPQSGAPRQTGASRQNGAPRENRPTPSDNA
jgi:uncharacterized membrane protein YfcA